MEEQLKLITQQLIDLNKNILPNNWDIALVFATIFLGLVAIFGDRIRKYFFKPRLEFQKIKTTSQSIGEGNVIMIHRLIIKNIGWSPAYNVRVILSEIYEKERYSNYLIRENFIPAILNWTHMNKNRDISRDEIVYLDVAQHDSNSGKYKICWPLDLMPIDRDLTEFDSNKNFKLIVDFFEKDRKLERVELLFNPSHNNIKIKN